MKVWHALFLLPICTLLSCRVERACKTETDCQKNQRCVLGLCLDRCINDHVRCGDWCVLLEQNVKHCGQCGRACAEGEVCTQGTCKHTSCVLPLRECGGKCVSLDNNTKHCGQCSQSCAEGEVCALGHCGIQCPPSLPTLCSGKCVRSLDDPKHCGACDRACAMNQMCMAGQCRCIANTERCSDRCADVRTDRKHCGRCEQACPTHYVCVEGQCAAQCPVRTPTMCFGTCVDIKTDREHCGSCGNACTPNEECVEGQRLCRAPYETCRGACVNIQNNIRHCGACGTSCASGQVCVSGRCRAKCPKVTETSCFGGCFDLRASGENCGSCGNRCAEGFRCVEGSCRRLCLTEALHLCGNTCVDLQKDRLFCGDCNIRCAPEQLCAAGRCTCPTRIPTLCKICLKGDKDCVQRCIDTQSDAQHCGACAQRCATDERCHQGRCQKRCPVERPTFCRIRNFSGAEQGFLCVDVQSDVLHCGQCDQACHRTQKCDKGQCVCSDAEKTYCTQAQTCVNLKLDAQHCGRCGVACAAGEKCMGGRCVCKACRWISSGATDHLQTVDVAVSKNGTVHSAVVFRGALNWGILSVPLETGIRLLVTQHDAEGRLRWHRVFRCTGGLCAFRRVLIRGDDQGNSYLALEFKQGILDFKTPETSVHQTSVSLGSDQGVVLAKINHKGILRWLRVFRSDSSAFPHVFVNDIKVSSGNGMLCLLLFFYGTLKSSSFVLSGQSADSLGIVSLRTSDATVKWSHFAQMALLMNMASLTLTQKGDVLIVLQYQGRLILNNLLRDSFSGRAIRSYVMTSDAQGKVLWERHLSS
ncbi:MAG: MXAN_6577-like cysteine-rich protein, partial [Myxococcota bacterium]